VAVFLSSIPVTIFMNSLRIGSIGVMVEHYGIGAAEGFVHEFQGWMVFMLSVLLLIGEMMLLNRVGHEAGSWRELFGIVLPEPTPPGVLFRKRPVPRAFVAAAAVLVAFVLGALALPRPAEVTPLRDSLVDFPLQFGKWAGRRGALEGIYIDQLKLDDYFLGDFTDGDRGQANLYIAYYNSQRKGEAVHSPRSCLPGGGWELRDFDQRDIPSVTINGQRLRVNRTLIELGNQRQLVYYFFLQRGRIITNEFVVKWFLFWDAVTRHRTDGALVRLITPLPLGSSEAAGDRELTEFATRIAPILPAYIPN
jgi:exosortase D (VPLPA-CTERM-specific)